MNSIVNILIYDCYDVFQHKIWKTESDFPSTKMSRKKNNNNNNIFRRCDEWSGIEFLGFFPMLNFSR